MKRNTYLHTVTCVEEKVIKKTNEKLYLVLKKKGLPEQIIDEINAESQNRLEDYLMQILPKLKNMYFDNPEEALECLILKQMIIILDNMFKERLPLLSERDKKALFETLEKPNDEEEKKRIK